MTVLNVYILIITYRLSKLYKRNEMKYESFDKDIIIFLWNSDYNHIICN